MVGRFFTVNEKSEKTPKGSFRWYLITKFTANADGTKDIEIQRFWWGAKSAGSPTLYRTDNYTWDGHLRPLAYVIAPGAYVNDVARAIPGGDRGGQRTLGLSAHAGVGTPFDFEKGDPVAMATMATLIDNGYGRYFPGVRASDMVMRALKLGEIGAAGADGFERDHVGIDLVEHFERGEQRCDHYQPEGDDADDLWNRAIDTGMFHGIGQPAAIGGLLELVRTGAMSIIVAMFIVVLVAAITYFVVFVERGQRKILVNYARRQVGNKVYGGQSSHLPLKLNMSGVIPPIFASSIILLPSTIVSWFSAGSGLNWLKDISAALSPGQPLYVLLYAIAIVFFCFFYTALVFNSRETADNLKKSGGFIPGIRPGDQTARFIDKILLRLTLAGAIYITFVCLVPEFLILKYNVPFYFGGTSLLIIVVVTMDFMAQVQNYLMSQQYESLLKKAHFKMAPGN